MSQFIMDEHFFEMENKGSFRLHIPDKINMAQVVVDYWVDHGRADTVAIYHKDEKFTYGDLKVLTNKFANALKSLGLKKGDRYLIRTPNILQFQVSYLGGQKIGAVPIPTSYLFREYELEYILNNSQSVAVITTPKYLPAIENLKDKCLSVKNIIVIGGEDKKYYSFEEMIEKGSPDLEVVETHKNDPAYMLYTSGTTGAPKGVVHAHRWIIGTGDPIGKFVLGLEKGDICGGPTPLTWMYALGDNFLYPLRWGVSTAIYSEERFDVEKSYEYIEKYKITIFSGSPTIFRMMLALRDAEKRYNLSSLKYCISSGEPLLAETWREWKRRFGVKILDSIGQTEAHIFCSTQTNISVKIGSMGKPLPGIEVAVVNDKGERVPMGEIGHLVIRRDYPGLLVEYYKTPELMREVILPNNWYCTKDLARIDEDGYFWYVSRSDDIMTSKGYRISPAEVETALQEHAAVLESGVAGVFDPETGEKVKAWVVLHKEYEPLEELKRELQEHVKNIIAPYKYPREIEFVKELPKTSSGKILRRVLREQEKKKYQ